MDKGPAVVLLDQPVGAGFARPFPFFFFWAEVSPSIVPAVMPAALSRLAARAADTKTGSNQLTIKVHCHSLM
jgi:hypothetical protein